jgi:hypothetical protein
MKQMESWIKLFRKIREWEWYQDGNTFRLFLELILTANIEDKKWRGVDVKRGQIITGRIKLSKILGVSEQSIRTSLTKLKSTNELTIKSTNKYTLITINNYNLYQQLTNKSTNEQPTTNQQLTTTKEYKNIRIKEVKKSKYSDPSHLTDDNFQEIANKYLVPISFVKSKFDDMINWHEKNPQKNYYKNYLSALRDWVKRDSLKIKQGGTNGKFVIADLTTG